MPGQDLEWREDCPCDDGGAPCFSSTARMYVRQDLRSPSFLSRARSLCFPAIHRGGGICLGSRLTTPIEPHRDRVHVHWGTNLERELFLPPDADTSLQETHTLTPSRTHTHIHRGIHVTSLSRLCILTHRHTHDNIPINASNSIFVIRLNTEKTFQTTTIVSSKNPRGRLLSHPLPPGREGMNCGWTEMK
jgi:hypothetical protein